MPRGREIIISFVLEKMKDEPIYRRIELCIALSHICGDPDEAQTLEAMAKELADAELSHREFAFSFSLKNPQLKLDL